MSKPKATPRRDVERFTVETKKGGTKTIQPKGKTKPKPTRGRVNAKTS